ncbi:MAG: tetratricopeptide repeat protein [Bacteroidota bacterium]|nr:tetratricopeptide repeat protein [Bacteroidota bacterium]
MKQLFCLSLFLISFRMAGQLTPKEEHTVDSLKSFINKAQHDTLKINAYTAWDNIIYMSDPKLDQELNLKIVDLANENLKKESLNSSEKKAFKKALSLGYNSLGIIFYNKGNYDKAINYYSRSLKIREEIGDKKGIAATLNNFGIVYQDQGDNAKAIECYTRSLKTNEEIGDKKGEANTLSNIGRIYREQHDTSKAIYYQTRSLKLRESIGDKRGMAIAFSNIGSIYSDQGNITKAMEYFLHYLKISEEIGDKNNIALALGNIGLVYKNQGDNVKALDYYSKSLKMFEEIGKKKWMAASLTNIGEIYKQKGEIEKAIDFYKNALVIAQSAGLVAATKDASQSLFTSYKITGNYKEALKMHELYIMMRDSILSENSQKAIMKQEIKSIFDKQKALDAKENEKQKAVSAEREQKQTVAIYGITGSLVLVLVFTFFVFNRLRFTRKQNKIIEEQKNLVEGKQKEILSSITYAKRLQEAILPPDHYVKTYLPASFIFYKPKDIVAGDFYWMERRGETLFVAAADCTGHGVPGAMVSVICSNALNRAVLELGITEPGKILDKTRELVLETFSRSDKEVKDGMDISLASINTNTDEIKWSGANNPLWYISNGELIEVKANKQAIGKTDSPLPFTTHSFQLNKGDSFYLSTDGYADQFGGINGKKLKKKALKQMLLQNSLLSPAQQKEKLESSFNNWMGTLEQIDDVCMIGVKI